MARRERPRRRPSRTPLLSRSEEVELGRRLRTARDEVRARVLETELGRILLLRQLGPQPAEGRGCAELIGLAQRNQALAQSHPAERSELDLARQDVTRLLDSDANLQRALDAAAGEWVAICRLLHFSSDRRPARALGYRSFRAAGLEPAPLARSWLLERRLRTRSVFGRLLSAAREVERARDEFFAARERFVAANQRLVIHLTKRYEGRGISHEDLVQEGNLGLVRAAEQYDHRLGFRFSTYAVWWVRQAMARAVAEQAGDIRLPYVQYERVGKVSRAARDFMQAFGREPSPDELASRTDLSAQQVQTTLGAGRAVASLQQPAGESGSQPLGNFMADTEAASPCDEAERRELIEQLTHLVDALPEREAGILRLRFGLGAEREHTLEEIGQQFELTRERIRQLEARALGRLRRPSQRRLLDCFERAG